MAEYKLELSEPWTVLNARGNPAPGRRLTYRYKDNTIFIVDVTEADALQPDVVKARLEEQIKAHEALKAL